MELGPGAHLVPKPVLLSLNAVPCGCLDGTSASGTPRPSLRTLLAEDALGLLQVEAPPLPSSRLPHCFCRLCRLSRSLLRVAGVCPALAFTRDVLVHSGPPRLASAAVCRASCQAPGPRPRRGRADCRALERPRSASVLGWASARRTWPLGLCKGDGSRSGRRPCSTLRSVRAHAPRSPPPGTGVLPDSGEWGHGFCVVRIQGQSSLMVTLYLWAFSPPRPPAVCPFLFSSRPLRLCPSSSPFA